MCRLGSDSLHVRKRNSPPPRQPSNKRPRALGLLADDHATSDVTVRTIMSHNTRQNPIYVVVTGTIMVSSGSAGVGLLKAFRPRPSQCLFMSWGVRAAIAANDGTPIA